LAASFPELCKEEIMKKLLTLFIVLSILVPGLFAQDEGELTWSGQVRAEYNLTNADFSNPEGLSGGDSLAEVNLTYVKGLITLTSALGGKYGLGAAEPDTSGDWKTPYDWRQGATRGIFNPYFKFGAVAEEAGVFKVNLALKLNWDASDGIWGLLQAPFNEYDWDSTFGPNKADPLDVIESIYGQIYFIPETLRFDAVYKGWDDTMLSTPGPLGGDDAGKYGNVNGGGFRFVYTPQSFLKGLTAGIYLPMFSNGQHMGSWLASGIDIGAKYATEDGGFTAVAAFTADSYGLNKIAAGAQYFIIPEVFSVKADTKFSGFGDDIAVNLGLGAEYTKQPITSLGANLKLFSLGTKTPKLSVGPFAKYSFIEGVSMAKLAVTFTQGLESKGASELAIEPGYFHSLKGAVTDGLGDYSGFLAKYTFKWDLKKATTNALTVGFRWVF
jgi:hypothetical protein